MRTIGPITIVIQKSFFMIPRLPVPAAIGGLKKPGSASLLVRAPLSVILVREGHRQLGNIIPQPQTLNIQRMPRECVGRR